MVVTDKGVEVLTARPGGKAMTPHFMDQLEAMKWILKLFNFNTIQQLDDDRLPKYTIIHFLLLRMGFSTFE